ncbi:hypothetical protein [Methylotenera sp.]|uniref:hypothetical protein n=1 Tax=Methylotenera sp. TaxID=2051956 RepID=UPI00248A522A|nr:hypothetical protein [Methylotenera sp.]MDI1299036.1 hypothetical protein [Methylotenera sp.]
MSQNESAIEQINLSFNEQEDRLLLKVGLADKTEVAVWITRRVCKVMWNLLHGVENSTMPTAPQFALPAIATPDAKKEAIDSFSREATELKEIENLDFKSEYLVDRESRSEVPMLAAQCLIVGIVNLPPQLELQCTNGQSVKIALTPQLVHAVTNMMQLATREAGWDLLMTVDNREVSVISSHQTLH